MSKKKKKKNKNSAAKAFVRFSTFFLVMLTVTYVLANYVFRRSVVHNGSMMNTLFDGDNIIMDELSYNVGEPERFDVICFKSYREKNLLIKRIIGMPGETVHIENGDIYINGEVIKDRAGLDKIDDPGLAAGNIILSDDEYFVVGDNRAESTDSRSEEVGCVRRSDILGKASIVIWPVNHIGVIK